MSKRYRVLIAPSSDHMQYDVRIRDNWAHTIETVGRYRTYDAAHDRKERILAKHA